MKHCLVCGSDEIDLLTTINRAPAEAQCFLKSRVPLSTALNYKYIFALIVAMFNLAAILYLITRML